jgi:hypothetical protein
MGIAIPTVGLAIYPLWLAPGTSATGSAIADWAQEHQSRLQAMMVCYTIGVTLWLAFGASVWALLRSALPPDAVETSAFGAGLVGFVTLLLAGFTAFDLLVYRQQTATEAKLLYDLTFGLLAMSGLPTALCLGAYARAVYRTRALPTHTAHLAVAAAIAHLLLLLAFIAPTGPLSLEGFSIIGIPGLLWAWILVTALAIPGDADSAR